jgi:hypothetical protein
MSGGIFSVSPSRLVSMQDVGNSIGALLHDPINSRKIQIEIEHLPVCAFRNLGADSQRRLQRILSLGGLLANCCKAKKVKARVCQRCPQDMSCAGFDLGYLQTFAAEGTPLMTRGTR